MDKIIAFLLISLIVLFFAYYKSKNHVKKLKYVDNYIFPKNVIDALSEEYPDLSENELEIILRGLKNYFKLTITSNRREIVMPSLIADKAWHYFILNTLEYESFCKNAFDRYLHHLPLKGVPIENNVDQNLKIVWKLSCNEENIDPVNPKKLPLLFALDSQLNISNGCKYGINNFENDLVFNAKNIGCLGISSEYGGRAF